jgi:hypothetical protein
VDGGTFGFNGADGTPASPDSTVTGASDVSLTASVPIGDGAIYGTYVYDFKIDAQYFETGASYTFGVTPWMSLVPSVAIGYGMDYYTYQERTGISDGFTATRVMLTAPVQLTPSAAFIPYVGANFSMEARDQLNTVEGQNDLYGGAKFSVTF